jgi:hypothetical protein
MMQHLWNGLSNNWVVLVTHKKGLEDTVILRLKEEFHSGGIVYTFHPTSAQYNSVVYIYLYICRVNADEHVDSTAISSNANGSMGSVGTLAVDIVHSLLSYDQLLAEMKKGTTFVVIIAICCVLFTQCYVAVL